MGCIGHSNSDPAEKTSHPRHGGFSVTQGASPLETGLPAAVSKDERRCDVHANEAIAQCRITLPTLP